jgi:hypothetical protein
MRAEDGHDLRLQQSTLGGGESGIRTHGRLTPTAVFKTAALNHSAISPELSAPVPWVCRYRPGL